MLRIHASFGHLYTYCAIVSNVSKRLLMEHQHHTNLEEIANMYTYEHIICSFSTVYLLGALL